MDEERTAEVVDDRSWTRRFHDHTHEAELLVSGALLFGLLQAPEALDSTFDAYQPRLSDTAWFAAFFAWYYVKLIVYALVISLGLHLVARAYWVGLVGLDSAFPEGIDWEQMRYGPLVKRTYRGLVPELATMARLTDRFASAIFAFAFIVVSLFVFSILGGALFAAPAWLIGRLVTWVDWHHPWLGMVAIFALTPTMATALDRAFGERIDSDGRAGRAIERITRAFYLRTGAALFLPVQFVLFTRIRKGLIWPLYFGFLTLLLATFAAGLVLRSPSLVIVADDLLPTRPVYRSVDDRYFAPRRDAASIAPFIQAEIVTDPYLRLELPFELRHESERARAVCAKAGVIGSRSLPALGRAIDAPADAATTDAVLACLARLWEVRLDGARLDVEWDFRSAPGTGVTALLTYLPTAPLAAGAHTLEVLEVDPGDQPEAGDAELRHHVIRFRT